MVLHAVESSSLPDQVFAQLASEIVAGRYRSGDRLPPERTLSGLFAVNRHVVREALGRLEQLGMVRIVQGGGTRVLDYRRTAGLDLLAVLAAHGELGPGTVALLRSALEMRVGIGVDVARLCARRAGHDVRTELVTVGQELAALGAGPALLAVDQRFWQLILDGAANLAYQLAFNSLIAGVQALPELSAPWIELELARTDFRRPIAAAIAAGDGEAAAIETRAALQLAVDAVADLADTPGASSEAG